MKAEINGFQSIDYTVLNAQISTSARLDNIPAVEGHSARTRSVITSVPGLHAPLDKNSVPMGPVNVSGIQGKKKICKANNWFDDLIGQSVRGNVLHAKKKYEHALLPKENYRRSLCLNRSEKRNRNNTKRKFPSDYIATV